MVPVRVDGDPLNPLPHRTQTEPEVPMSRFTPPKNHALTVLVGVEPFYMNGRNLNHVTLILRWATRESVADRLAGTVDNRAGYGTAEAAQEIARQCAALLRNGVTHTYDPTYAWSSSTAGMELSWQQYDDVSYCDRAALHADGERNIAAWETRVAFYRWLEAKVEKAGGSLHDPRDLLTALRKAGGVPLLSWKDRKRIHGEFNGCGGWIEGSWDDMLAALPVAAKDAREAG